MPTRTHVRLRIATAIALAALPAGCKRKPADKPPVAASEPALKLAPEDIVVVARGTLQTGPRISGTLEARLKSSVRAETGGAVVAVGPELGQTVKKNDLLARIEAKALGDVTTSAQSAVASAQAQLELARREVQRTEALVKGGALAARELDRVKSQATAAETAVVQARAGLASSRSQLGDATARSPIAGVVARRSVNQGDVVSPGAELYEIIDPSTMRLDASVSSEDLGALTVDKTVDFEVRGYPGQKFAGAIARIAPAADPVTRQIQVLVDIPNPGGKLVAGLYAEGRVAVEQREGLIVPLAAVDSAGDQPTVLRAKNGVIDRQVVALGLRDERAETVEVTSGLAAGDVLLLIRAAKSVMAGTKVEVPGQTTPAPAPVPAPRGSGAAPPPAAAPTAAEK